MSGKSDVRVDANGETRPRRGSRWMARAELLLWLGGLSALGVAGWTVADASLFQARAERQLERAWTTERAVAASPAAGRIARAEIADGTPMARLAIPRLGLSTVVAEGVDDAVLRRSLGHVPASARPGEGGNVALAGHRDTFFRAIENVVVGDEIELESAGGTDLYRVEWVAVVEPSEVVVTSDAGYPALTLLTCYPFGYVGSAPYRYVVRARRLDDGAPPTRARGSSS